MWSSDPPLISVCLSISLSLPVSIHSLEFSFVIPSSCRLLQPLKKRKINLYFCFFSAVIKNIKHLEKKQLKLPCPFFCVSFLLVYSLFQLKRINLWCLTYLSFAESQQRLYLLYWDDYVEAGVSSVCMQIWINGVPSQRWGFKVYFYCLREKIVVQSGIKTVQRCTVRNCSL